jgi:hypothetical protein
VPDERDGRQLHHRVPHERQRHVQRPRLLQRERHGQQRRWRRRAVQLRSRIHWLGMPNRLPWIPAVLRAWIVLDRSDVFSADLHVLRISARRILDGIVLRSLPRRVQQQRVLQSKVPRRPDDVQHRLLREGILRRGKVLLRPHLRHGLLRQRLSNLVRSVAADSRRAVLRVRL